MKVAVLGSTSPSGATFIDHALAQGAEVVGISRSQEPNRAFLPYRWTAGRDAGFSFHALDINHHLDQIEALLRRERPGFVVNYAGQGMVAESWKNPDHWFMTNTVSMVRLHERLRRMDFLERYLHFTTPEVYGSTNGLIAEDAPFKPSTPYAVSKAAADLSLQTYHATYGFPVVFTRAANVYGPGQQLYRIIPRTILSIKLGRRLTLDGGGVATRSFVHFTDVADATWRALLHGKLGETYHIATDEIVSIRSLVERICTRLGARFADVIEIGAERVGQDAAYRLDTRKIRRELGWQHQIGLEAGLDSVVRWVEDNLEVLRDMSLDYRHKP